MDRIIQKIAPAIQPHQNMTRVCAYARVSSDKESMFHSLSAQVSYYNTLIQEHPGWLFCGVYTDNAMTGTKENRADFQRMLNDCRAGNIDMIITKSISRFARNTVTLLETVRELKALCIDVYFEEQNIHSMDGTGELMMTILASFAQEESLSVSENMKWRVRKNFEDGKPWNCTMLGYRNGEDGLVIVPDEATTVRFIFEEYLGGKGGGVIAKELNANGINTRNGSPWSHSSIQKVLRNYAYTGNLLLQTTYCENHLTKKMVPNNGELQMYHAEFTHEPIVSLEDYNAVQKEIERRAEHYKHKPREKESYPFSGLIVCGSCGKNYRRKIKETGPVWICATYNTKGKKYCASQAVPEYILENLTGNTDLDSIEQITAFNGGIIEFLYKNGTAEKKEWHLKERKYG